MRLSVFSLRNSKEIVRDPLNLAFGIAFPIVLILLFTAIQANIPVNLFEIQSITPGIAVFGLSFLSLFSGMLIAKDRSTSFLMRLFASPLSPSDFILGYALPLLPMAVAQSAVCFGVAFLLGLQPGINVLVAIAVIAPVSVLYIAIGLLAGSLFSDKLVGGTCGALLTNVSAWLSGTWFDLELVGGTYREIAYALPFVHAVNAARAAVAGNYTTIPGDLIWVAAYAIAVMAVAVWVFSRRMRSTAA